MRRVFLFASVLLACGCAEKQATKPEERAAEKSYYRVDPATAARVRGSVRFAGRKPPAKPISMNAEEGCERLHSKPVDGSGFLIGDNGALANVFVYVKSGLEGKQFEPPKQAVMLDQRGCMFAPRVVALQTGQTLTVENSDPVSHNIHPNPKNNREWNQQQSPGAPDLTRRFGFAEVMIPVKCNVHSWMRSYIGVMGHPYIDVTGEAGEFEWDALPPGEYVVAAWHEMLGELTEKISVGARSEAELRFVFKQ